MNAEDIKKDLDKLARWIEKAKTLTDKMELAETLGSISEVAADLSATLNKPA
jgi:hypothetical protein